jgi:hypothetical protein
MGRVFLGFFSGFLWVKSPGTAEHDRRKYEKVKKERKRGVVHLHFRKRQRNKKSCSGVSSSPSAANKKQKMPSARRLIVDF